MNGLLEVCRGVVYETLSTRLLIVLFPGCLKCYMVVENVCVCVCVCMCVCVCVFGIIRCEGGRAFSQLSVDGRNIIKIIMLLQF